MRNFIYLFTLLSSLFLCFVAYVSTDSQRLQTKLFFQQVLKGNIDFSIVHQVEFQAGLSFDKLWGDNILIEKNTKESVNPSGITPSVHFNSVKGKYQNLYSCHKKPAYRLNESRLYKWKDSQGQMHFGDRFPSSKDYHDLVIQNLKQDSFFSLNLDSRYSKLPPFAADKMKRDINHIYKILIKSVGVSQLNPIQLNLKLFDDKNRFNFYKKQVAPSLGAAGGFYISGLNEASVYTGQNDRRMYDVTRHEATHAIVNGAFGRIPTWLNEGLAEYFEQLSFHNSMLRVVSLNKEHLRLISRSNFSGISRYFKLTTQQWYAEPEKSKHYALGWSIVYFLMSSSKDKQFLSYMLDHLAYNYCKPFSDIDYINRYYLGGLLQFEENWKHWLAGLKRNHKY